MAKPRFIKMFVSLVFGAISLIANLVSYSHEHFVRAYNKIDVPITVKVEAVIAAAYAIKTQIAASYRVFRRSATNVAARHVAMLRGKGPVTA